MKLSQGDTVHVISGKDKGKRGTILRVLRDQNRVIVSGINMVTKHVKKTPNEAGKKLHFERSISASNVMIVDPKTNKPTRIGYQIDPKTGAKARIAKGSKSVIGRSKVEAPKAKQAPASTSKAPSKDKEAAPAKKAPFWKKMGMGADVAGGSSSGSSGKTESGPAASAPGHTRSAGRGS